MMKVQYEKFQVALSFLIVLTTGLFLAADVWAADKCNGAPCTIECVGPEPCEGTDGDDVICGDDDGQTIFARAGNDIICAGDGNDIVFGGAGNDDIAGEGGNDMISGEEGNDSMAGGTGHDVLAGDDGFDIVLGQGGEDTCVGEVTFQCE